MEKQVVIKKVCEQITEQTGVRVSVNSMDSRFIEDLGLDPLDVVEIIMSTEKAFNITVDDYKTDYPDMCTVGDLVRYIANNLSDTRIKIARTSHDVFLTQAGHKVDPKSVITPEIQQVLDHDGVSTCMGPDGGLAFRKYGSRFYLDPTSSGKFLDLIVRAANKNR